MEGEGEGGDVDMQSEAQQHKMELEKLRDTQKEFFDFLAKENSDLLNFDVSEDSKQENEAEEEVPINELTEELLEKLKTKANELDIKSIKILLGAFRIACHINDEKEDEFKFNYSILSSEIFNDIIIFCCRDMGEIFDKFLNITPENAEDKNFLPSKISKWKKIKYSVKNYLANMIHFIDQLTEPKMITFILKCTEKKIYYLAPFPKLTKIFLKKLLKHWGASEESVRIISYLNIRNLAIKIPYPFINDCLKGLYLSYVKNVKFTNVKTMGLINFLSNCVVDLYGIDFNASYQHAYVYIREVAVHLRTAYNTKTSEAHESIYNWQTFNSIRVWVKLLAAYPEQEELKLLLFPLIQIIQGIIAYVPTPKFYPMRFLCLRLLNELNKVYGSIYINTASYLLEVINGPLFKTKSKPYTGKPLVMNTILKAQDNILNTKSYQNSVLTEVHDILLEYLLIYSNSIAFPELILPIVLNLKKFIKNFKVPFFSKRFNSLMDKINLNAKYVLAKRNVVNFAPSDIEKVNAFLSESNNAAPLAKYAKIGMIRKETDEITNQEDDEDVQEEEETTQNKQTSKKRKLNNLKSSQPDQNITEDYVEDLVLSDDEEEDNHQDDEEISYDE